LLLAVAVAVKLVVAVVEVLVAFALLSQRQAVEAL
jgi:hypothetical protein